MKGHLDMGMYTELNLAIEIKDDKNVIDILNNMLDVSRDLEISKIPNDKFFRTERWGYMLNCDSFYFPGQTDSKLVCHKLPYRDKPLYFLNVRCNLKNYSNEIEYFLDWIQPYILTRGFLGYMRYEEAYDPTLIYNEDGIKYK